MTNEEIPLVRGPGIILSVSNPVDILTYAALKISGCAMNRVIGSGATPDTARFKFLLSRHCRADPRHVHTYIPGEHGDSGVNRGDRLPGIRTAFDPR
jgi:L-lactate dehydrogenase